MYRKFPGYNKEVINEKINNDNDGIATIGSLQ